MCCTSFHLRTPSPCRCPAHFTVRGAHLTLRVPVGRGWGAVSVVFSGVPTAAGKATGARQGRGEPGRHGAGSGLGWVTSCLVALRIEEGRSHLGPGSVTRSHQVPHLQGEQSILSRLPVCVGGVCVGWGEVHGSPPEPPEPRSCRQGWTSASEGCLSLDRAHRPPRPSPVGEGASQREHVGFPGALGASLVAGRRAGWNICK